MDVIYIPTKDVDLDTFLKFSFNKLKIQDKKITKYWNSDLKDMYIMYYQSSEIVLINNFGEYIGSLGNNKENIGDDLFIWDINDIEFLNCYENEFFDFDNYINLIKNIKYKISSIGLNKTKNWIYIEVENKFTNYRSFVVNINFFTSYKKYIRQERINKLF